MTAAEFVTMHGTAPIGRRINTEAWGFYPGGVATVIEVVPDPNAPEIVLQVRHPGFGEIGIFEHEEVSFAEPDSPANPRE